MTIGWLIRTLLALRGRDVGKRLLKVEEVRRLVGEDRLGRDAAYALARRYGVRLGKRLLVPSRVVEALLEGKLEELEKTPGVEARGR